ncbi:MAG: SRPBCC family protein [Caulobacteraceae bacterium]
MTTTAADARTLVIERDLAQPPAKVWRALTQSALMADWLMENDFEPVVGRKFTLRSKPMPPQWDGLIHCEVLAVEPERRLSYAWCSMGVETVVAYTLTPTAGGARLRMEQSGFRPDQERNYQGAAYGWKAFLDGLERVVGAVE